MAIIAGETMRLARKLILAVVLGMLLIVIAHDYTAVREDTRDYQQRIADDVATLGYGLSVTLAQVVRGSGPAAAEALIARRNLDSRIRIRWVALDVPPTDQRAIDLPEPMVAALRQGQPTRIIRGGDSAARLFVYRAFINEAPVHDVVEASESLAPMYQRAHRRKLGIVVESVVILVLAGVAVLVLGLRMIARPVQQLVAQARRIGTGDLSQRLQLAGHHELSELAVEMNLMCDRLVAARDELAAESAAKLTAVEQLRHADRLATVGQLASGVAHELGTPLNVVAGYAKMITSAEGTPGEDRDSARIIAEQASRMTAIIRQLLDFARGGKPQLHTGELAVVAGRTVSMLAHLATQRHVELQIQPMPQGARVRMDEGQMQQVITNLVLNAIQAMPDGGRIDISLEEARASRPGQPASQRDCVCLSIADQGAGMAPDVMAHIFEPFFTT
ncbi:MAG: two-component system, NtrC family, sensor kinase, partial [Myxococcales bacterium]|nr:two-component system, NtrC family, sensor kinase [Myxococcales bacterium]